MKVTSYGAAEEVTGSKHLLEINGSRILLDCGMFQGHRKEADRKNRHVPFDPKTLDAIVLSHAHIDHCGLLPLFVKEGFGGAIYTTQATRDLCSIMLLDSAHIQERESEWLSKKKQIDIAPLYKNEDVHETLRRFVSMSYGVSLPVAPGVQITFHDAGHVLGSAMIEVNYEEDGQPRKFIFSGDIGRMNMPILNDPWAPTDADVVMMECTYGNRDHDPIKDLNAKFAQIINDTCERGGKLIIPTFALERAQEVVYALKELEISGAIPKIPVFVDSPMTVNITEVFRLHTESFDKDFGELMEAAGDPFQLDNIRYVRDTDQSIALNDLKGSAIILSASGMCEFGRIVHHLRNNCADAKNTILIVGYQARNTLGRRIMEKQPRIKIFGVEHPLNAKVEVMNEFSAHAGRSELIDFGARFKDRAEKMLLVHGESDQINKLKVALETKGMSNIVTMKEGRTIEV